MKNIFREPLTGRQLWLIFGAILCSWIASTRLGLLIVDAIYHGDITGGLATRFMQKKDVVPLSDYQADLWQLVFLAHLLVTLYLALAVNWRFKSTARFWTILIIGDAIIITGSVVFEGAFRVWREPSLPEFWQNSKELFTAGCFFWLWRNRHQPIIFAALSALFLWFFADDAFKYHEWAGGFLASHLDLNALLFYEGLREQDIGEILSLALPLFLIFPFVGYAYFKSDWPERRICHAVFGLIALLAFFGVFVDMLDRYSGLDAYKRLLVNLEDGGEMVAMSAIAAYVVSLVYATDNSSG